MQSKQKLILFMLTFYLQWNFEFLSSRRFTQSFQFTQKITSFPSPFYSHILSFNSSAVVWLLRMRNNLGKKVQPFPYKKIFYFGTLYNTFRCRKKSTKKLWREFITMWRKRETNDAQDDFVLVELLQISKKFLFHMRLGIQWSEFTVWIYIFSGIN